jgi:hypothetical protein
MGIKSAQSAKSQAVEETLRIVELRGSSDRGHYFSATDKAPGLGEYKLRTQGICYNIFFNSSSSLTGGRQVNPLQTKVVGTSWLPFSFRNGNQLPSIGSWGSFRLKILLGR